MRVLVPSFISLAGLAQLYADMQLEPYPDQYLYQPLVIALVWGIYHLLERIPE